MINVEEAYNILEWFNGIGWPVLDDKGKVTDPRCNTMEKMKSLLGEYFAPKYVKKLLSMGCYTSKKGGLYYTSGERGGRIDYLYCEYKFKSVSDKKRTIDTAVCCWKNYEEYPKKIRREHITFEQVKVNGKWLFSKIELPY